jgi:hypothetical protein
MTTISTDSNGHRWEYGTEMESQQCKQEGCTVYWPDRSDQRCARGAQRSGDLDTSDLSKDELAVFDWWLETARKDALHALTKSRQYGSADLRIMGKSMEALFPASELDRQSLEAMGLEMAVAFYEMGKAARLFGAYERGTAPSNDTWKDQTIYPMMARRIREIGRWP